MPFIYVYAPRRRAAEPPIRADDDERRCCRLSDADAERLRRRDAARRCLRHDMMPFTRRRHLLTPPSDAEPSDSFHIIYYAPIRREAAMPRQPPPMRDAATPPLRAEAAADDMSLRAELPARRCRRQTYAAAERAHMPPTAAMLMPPPMTRCRDAAERTIRAKMRYADADALPRYDDE